jgi:hypothetical protein
MAEKKAQARIVATASPPGRCLTQAFITSKRSSPTLPSKRIWLIRINKGMDKRVKLSMPENIVVPTILVGRL